MESLHEGEEGGRKIKWAGIQRPLYEQLRDQWILKIRGGFAMEKKNIRTQVDSDNHFTVYVARSAVNDNAISRIEKMVEAREGIIKKAIGAENLEIWITDEVIVFPWFTANEPAVEQAYVDFVGLLCDRAMEMNRASDIEREVVNERYAMRGFLIQIGAIGRDYGTMRRILMSNLSGSAAFKDKKRKEEMGVVEQLAEMGECEMPVC